MDTEKLEALRARYAGGKAGDIRDPAFARVAATQFASPDERRWPFAGPPTLLGAPHRADGDPSGLDVALVGVPMDLGVTNRAGARLGPRAVRNVERIGPYEHALRCAPAETLRFADLGDVPMASRFDLARCHADIEAFFARLRAAGVVPLAVGGDHSVSYPILRALGAGGRPLGLVHIDAHCDTAGEFEGSKFNHAGPFRQAALDGVLDPERTIQIGIRGPSEWLWEFSRDSGMTVIHAEELDALGIPAVVARARAVAGGGPVYVSFDVDALDPAFAPGTGTPEPGGLSTREALAILRGLAGLDVVGADVVEVAPAHDPTSVTAQAAAQVLFTQLCLVALRGAATDPAGEHEG
jgi:agmatinase